MQPALCAVAHTTPERRACAVKLAVELGLPLAGVHDQRYAYLLVCTTRHLELRHVAGRAGPIYAEFIGGRLGYRRRHGGGWGQTLARAVGLKHNHTPSVIDATAGLGRDAFILATLGATVYMLERSPIVAALLADGLRRATLDATVGPLARQRLRLQPGDSRVLLPKLTMAPPPQVIYLDPMYPERKQTALVKKELRVLRELVGDDDDAPGLLAAALAGDARRVVVKRPSRAPVLAGPAPSFALASKNTRYDVYLAP